MSDRSALAFERCGWWACHPWRFERLTGLRHDADEPAGVVRLHDLRRVGLDLFAAAAGPGHRPSRICGLFRSFRRA